MTSARLTIAAGPRQGETILLTDELTHVGSGADNHVALEDPAIAEHAFSIMQRNGRYAVYSAVPEAVQVDGEFLPAEQWVWMPAAMKLSLSPETVLEFHNEEPEAAAKEAAPPAPVSKKTPPAATPNPAPAVAEEKTPVTTESPKTKKGAAKSKGGAKKSEGGGRKEAKFITDRSGETLVRLGEDGHLPELALTEAATGVKKGKQEKQKGGNPALIYAAVGFSLLSTLAMLFLESPASGNANLNQQQARVIILRDFVGSPNVEPKLYERLLRQAGLARSRSDFTAEQSYYLQVLELLNSEDKSPFTGLTGSPERDEELRKLLATLLIR